MRLRFWRRKMGEEQFLQLMLTEAMGVELKFEPPKPSLRKLLDSAGDRQQRNLTIVDSDA